jgi:hypothetical protein
MEMGWRMLAMSESLSNCAERRECRRKGDAMAKEGDLARLVIEDASERIRPMAGGWIDCDSASSALVSDLWTLSQAYLALAAEVRAVLALCDCHNKGLSDLNTVDGDMAKAIGRLRAAVGEGR